MNCCLVQIDSHRLSALRSGLMAELVAWVNAQRESRILHPLLIVAILVVVFLEIHPFQDGNEGSDPPGVSF